MCFFSSHSITKRLPSSFVRRRSATTTVRGCPALGTWQQLSIYIACRNLITFSFFRLAVRFLHELLVVVCPSGSRGVVCCLLRWPRRHADRAQDLIAAPAETGGGSGCRDPESTTLRYRDQKTALYVSARENRTRSLLLSVGGRDWQCGFGASCA